MSDDPFSQFMRMFGEGSDNHVPGASYMHAFVPAMDIAAIADSFIVRLDVPGMHSEDFQIDMIGNLLRISGQRKDDFEGIPRVHHERPHSEFSRQIQLPPNTHADEVIATCTAGVLTVTIPLSPLSSEEIKQIDVHDTESE